MHAALKAFAAVYTSVRLEHRNTTELETHTQRARVIEGEREREANWTLSVTVSGGFACQL